MMYRAGLASCLVLALPALATAQQINGLAEWTIGRAGSTYGGQSFENNALSQMYVLGLETPLVDSRLLRINTEGTFRTNALTIGTTQAAQKGDQRDVGYRFGASLFPLRPFPLTLQMARSFIDESGQYPSSSPVRGGVAITAGEIPPAFRTLNRTMNANWQLRAGLLPQVDVNYASGSSTTTGSTYRGAQDQRNLNLSAVKETARMRHALRYDRAATDNLVLSAYNQESRDLDYEFGALVGARSRLRVHAGRRRMVSQFDLPTPIVDSTAGTYVLPSRGDVATRYLITGLTFDPSTRLSFDVTGSLDRQESAPAESGARLLVASARVEAGRGLSLSATGTYGDRREVVDATAISVMTRSGQAGLTYRTGPQWLEGNLAFTRGMGSNRTPDGALGATDSWNGQGTISSSYGWLTVSGGRERSRSRDQILDFGNADVVRDRATLQVSPGRATFIASWEDSVVERGRDTTFASVWQRVGSASLSFPLARRATVTGNTGAFTNIGALGTDSSIFWGGSLEAEPAPALHLSAWFRSDRATATQASVNQTNLLWLVLTEYRLRDFTFGAEYRSTLQDLKSNPFASRFEGRQMLFRISRKVNIPL